MPIATTPDLSFSVVAEPNQSSTSVWYQPTVE